MAVRVLTDLALQRRDEGHVTIYPLDSTDPAALNEIVRKIAKAKNLALPTGKKHPSKPSCKCFSMTY